MSFFEGGRPPRPIPTPVPRGELSNAMQRHQGIVLSWTETEASVGWGTENSPLISKNPESWTYERSFKALFTPREGGLKEYIEKRFSSKAGEVRVLDLGSIGSEVRSGFSEGFVGRSAAVSLTDFRDKLDPALRKIDNARQHTVVTGDLLSRRTRHNVEEVLDGEAEVILSRMIMGTATLSDYPPFVAKRASDWYKMLPEDGGLIVAELPKTLKYYVPEWQAMVEKECGRKLRIKTSYNNSAIRIDKYKGAPDELPLLPNF